MVRLRKWFLAVCLFHAFPQPLEANAPLVAVGYFTGFPFMSAMWTFGLALIVVIFIEALVLRRREQLGFPEAFKLATFANVFSTLIGFLVFVTYSSSFAILPGLPF